MRTWEVPFAVLLAAGCVCAADGGDGGSVIGALVVGLFGLIWALMFAGFWLVWLLFFLFIIAGLIFWVMMLVDCVQREFERPDDKTLWALIVALTGVIGAIIYYFMVKRKSHAQETGVAGDKEVESAK